MNLLEISRMAYFHLYLEKLQDTIFRQYQLTFSQMQLLKVYSKALFKNKA